MKKQSIKTQVKEELIKQGITLEFATKGIARAERWIKAAYGEAGTYGWEERLNEGGTLEDLVGFVMCYVAEAMKDGGKPGARTFNRDAFGATSQNRRTVRS